MKREDIEFWNGALKCAIAMERRTRTSETLEKARLEVAYLRQQIEDIHINNFDEVLDQNSTEADFR